MGFMFGVSTSAFQLEGDDGTQGRGKSIWDSYCEREGTIYQNQNARVSTNHYYKYKEDVKLMAELGVDSYRFSISWSRIFPNGTGEINSKGVEFYNDLINELLKYNIKPFITFYHWDLPQALSDRGGLQTQNAVRRDTLSHRNTNPYPGSCSLSPMQCSASCPHSTAHLS